MRQRADHQPRRVARQLRVRIERDDVAHALQDRDVADDFREAALSRRGAWRSDRPACRACARSPSRRLPGRSSGAGDERDKRCRRERPRISRSSARCLRAPGGRAPRRRAAISAAASTKSVNKAKCRHGSRLARYRTSSPSSRCSMPAALVSIVGTATSVRCSGGMPCSKSIRGNDCGLSNCVANQLTSPSPKLRRADQRRHSQQQVARANPLRAVGTSAKRSASPRA